MEKFDCGENPAIWRFLDNYPAFTSKYLPYLVFEASVEHTNSPSTKHVWKKAYFREAWKACEQWKVAIPNMDTYGEHGPETRLCKQLQATASTSRLLV